MYDHEDINRLIELLGEPFDQYDGSLYLRYHRRVIAGFRTIHVLVRDIDRPTIKIMLDPSREEKLLYVINEDLEMIWLVSQEEITILLLMWPPL